MAAQERMVGSRILAFSYGYMGEDYGETRHAAWTVYYWTLVLGQVAAALCATTKRQPLFGEGGYGSPNSLLNITLVCELILSLVATWAAFLVVKGAHIPVAVRLFLEVMHTSWLAQAFESHDCS
ncbi:unnamed protein product [Effrenium voratum]|nr:unnamed protein product [Effrenium voratum]